MNIQDNENLKGLFERFLSTEQAEEAAGDVIKGEQIFSEHPCPEPNKKLIAGIKAEISKAVSVREAKALRRRIYEAVSVAAVFVILAAIGVKLFEKGDVRPERFAAASIIPAAIWESEDVAADDEDLAILTAEIEQIEVELLSLQLDENNDNGYETPTELEMGLI